MKTVKVEAAPATVNSGQVGLSKAQAATRMHALRMVGKADKDGNAVYDVTGPISFKVGESFGFSGDLSKTGQLRDPEAEAIARLDAEEKAVAKVRAEYETVITRLRETLQLDYEARLATLEADLRTKIEAELKGKGK